MENIRRAAEVLRDLNSDILLLQEVKDYEACARLADSISPNTYHVAVCSKFKGGNQQVAILARHHAWAAWSEEWKSLEGVDPPRGLAFAWFKIGKADFGVYSVHLKSNLVMGGNTELETAKNIRKREVASQQILDHIRTVIEPSMPAIKSVVIGGDFNTNTDQPMFASEKTLQTLTDAGFVNVLGALPLDQRITHPANHGYPPATFDYLFGREARAGAAILTTSKASDHYPVTCDFEIR